jgi:hypothetical protein
MHAALLSTLLVYCHVLLEWLFFVTKPSFLSAMLLPDQLGVLFASALGYTLTCVALLLPAALLGALKEPRAQSGAAALRNAVPAAILAALAFIAIDNFTYSLFEFGVVSTAGIWRSAYALLFLGLFFWSYRQAAREIASPPGKSLSLRFGIAAAVVVCSLIYTLARAPAQASASSAARLEPLPAQQLPDIILLGADGVEASHLQAYGYARATSPTLNALAAQSLLAESAFPNGGNTSGSLISILTGKLPTQTHLIFSPDILTGEDSYQHLPGLLKQLGYATTQITIGHYGDAVALNLLDGFDSTNFRRADSALQRRLGRLLGGTNGRYFSGLMLARLRERLEHAFYIRLMANAYESVTRPVTAISEQERIDGLLDFLDATDGPAFAHVHMMGTHGHMFHPRHRVFSLGQVQDRQWMTDFYDDAILDFDEVVDTLLKHLESAGTLDNTLIIIYSDHGMDWKTNVRVPLLMRFPGGQHQGRVLNNAQNLDIAPTVLDYLGVPIPDWMGGASLLAGEPPAERGIFAATVALRALTQYQYIWTLDQGALEPPFYQLGRISLIECSRWYALDLPDPALLSGTATNVTTCDPARALTEAQARAVLLQHLQNNGYDVSSLRVH